MMSNASSIRTLSSGFKSLIDLTLLTNNPKFPLDLAIKIEKDVNLKWLGTILFTFLNSWESVITSGGSSLRESSIPHNYVYFTVRVIPSLSSTSLIICTSGNINFPLGDCISCGANNTILSLGLTSLQE